MIDKTFIEKILEISKAELVFDQDRTYSTKNLHKVELPTPKPIPTTTLTSIVDFIKSEVDVHPDAFGKLFVHVMAPNRVELITDLYKPFAQRHTFMVAVPLLPQFAFALHMDMESFIVSLQANFLDSEDRTQVLACVGNIKEEDVRQTSDDGFSQAVTAKTGIARVSNVSVPNPVRLRPYRTFPEVEQPESLFVLRLKSGPTAALFESDGGAWRIEAMNNVKNFFEEALADTGVNILM